MNYTEVNQTDQCLQFACPERSVSAVYVLLYVSAAAVVLLTVFGNLLIIISVCHFKQLHTPTNMLILSLAVSDFLVGALVIPMLLIWTIETCWIFNAEFCLCYMLSSYFLTSISIHNVALIAVDRYFALSNPFLYTNKVSVRTLCIVVVCDWCVMFFYNLVAHYFSRNFKSLVMCPGDCYLALDENWSLVDNLVIFVIPCSLIIILYSLVFVLVRKHAVAIRELNVNTKTQTSHKTISMQSERKAAKVLGIVVSVFLACLFPYSIYSSLGKAIEVKVELFQKVLILVYLNSTVNPIIYALFYPWFRKCVKLVLTLQIFKQDCTLIKVM
uniref:Trace amine-associated receptor 13c-like n=1 Tax=Astyanax mexicanus TaxID=7994 RepID=A0A3B1IM36_ASTMX